jgi:hypothetical protein
LIPGGGKRRARFILPGLYLAFALYAWIDFTRINHDGLANVGLFLVTAPVTAVGLLIGWIIGRKSFVLLPDGFGYLGDHALYYVPAVAVTAALVWLLGRKIDRRPG